MVRHQSGYRAGVPQGSILGPLFFLIYINDLSIDIISTVKLFADDTSLFSIIHDAKTTAYELNKDLQKIAEWTHQWKMSFNPDLNKQAQEVIFSRKMIKSSHPQIFFNDIPVSCVSFQKYLGIYLHEKLNFNHDIKEKMTKAMKRIGVIKKLSKMLPQYSFLTIYKSFARPHLDYGDILYDQPTIKIFVKKLRLFNTMLPWPFILASSVLCREVRDSWITEARKAIIIAVTISEGKALQRQREVFS